nr:hypothetical protein [Phytohabitans rumicis]
MASCVLPTPPMPCSACTTARSPPVSRSRSPASNAVRPVNAASRRGTFHTAGRVPGTRTPSDAPGKRTGPCGRSGPSTAVRTCSRARCSSSPNRSLYTSGARIGGGATSSTRSGTSRRRPLASARCAMTAGHSSTVNRVRSK